jgi:hypothetical protein
MAQAYGLAPFLLAAAAVAVYGVRDEAHEG